MNAKLFINYRREDTRHAAGRLYDRLIQRFSEDQVFIDIDQIEPGEDFVDVINRKVGACDIAIVAIGPHWLDVTDASGKRRLDDEEDFVRMEIVAALQRNIRVIPVLVDGARMPGKHDLPEALAPLSRRNAIELSETRFHADVNRLIEAIEKSFAVAEKNVELSAPPDAPQSKPEKRQQDSLPITKPTTPFKSTQTARATSARVPDTSSFEERKGWTSERWILVSSIVLFLLVLGGFVVWLSHQKPATQGKQLAVATSEGVSKPGLASASPIRSDEKIPTRPQRYFADYAGVVSSDAASQFNEQLAQFERETSNQIVVAIYPKMESTAPIDGYTRRIANAWGVGQANRRNGVVLFVFVQDRKMFVQVGEGLADVLTNTKAFDITDHRIKPHFRSDDYEGGIREGLNAICDAARQAGFKGNGKTVSEAGLGAATSPSESTQMTPATSLLSSTPSNADAVNKYSPGVLDEQGKGVPKDLKKAADQGNALAQVKLGYLYQFGQGVPRDLEKAADFYQRAADQGNAVAQASLGWLYQNGFGVEKDLDKARELYQKAADQGNAYAQTHLGWLYEYSSGVPEDLDKARELYQKAADQGDAPGQCYLAEFYEKGWGVPKDLDKARELYQKAASQGNKSAIFHLENLPR